MPVSRRFIVIPAAGHSRRMGRAKLLLPLGEQTVIARVLGALGASEFGRGEFERPVVVVRPDDEPLRRAVEEAGGTALQPPAPPPQMRDSVEFALRWLEREYRPADDETWVLLPADHPLLSRPLIERLLDRWNRGDGEILIPTCEGRRGHPVFFRWRLAREVFELPAELGLNELTRRHANQIVEWDSGDRSVLTDLDTPADYQALQPQSGEDAGGLNSQLVPT